MTYEYIKDGNRLAFIQQRPGYCDRGRYHAIVEAKHWRSEADQPQRYYFNLQYAKEEMVQYMRAKKIDTNGGEWIEKDYNTSQIDLSEHMLEAHHG